MFKKVVSAALAVLLVAVLAVGCAGQPAASTPEGSAPAPVNVNVWAIKGPTGIGMVHLMQKDAESRSTNDYTFHIAGSQDEVMAKVISDEFDIASLPTNLAAKLYGKTGGKFTLLAVNTAGVLSILEKGDSIQSVADLRGKTIYSSGQGANPEYVLNYVLEKNGLKPGVDVTIRFVADNDALAAVMAADGEAEIAMIPEPVATSVRMKNANVRTALSMTEEWGKVSTDSALLMGCVVVSNTFLATHKDQVDAFMTEYAASIAAASDIDATAALCETYGIIPKAAVAKQAIPGSNLTYMDGADMKTKLSAYYQVLFDADNASIGAMPDDAFYYAK